MRKFLLLLLPAASLCPAVLRGDVTLPPLISDNMLLQKPNAALWGKADPGEKVTAKLGSVSASATADKSGNWKLKLKGLKIKDAGTLSIKGNNELNIRNVAVGEAWLASGQSNMQWPVAAAANPAEETAAANYPDIRMFTTPRAPSDTPKEEIAGKWEVCTPETVGKWSASAYYFARKLHQDLGVPVGIVQSSVGGTPAQAWTPREVLEADPELKSKYVDFWETALAGYPAAKEKYDADLAKWEVANQEATAAGKTAPRKPRAPATRPGSSLAPGALYNAMIHGAMNYTIKGAIWYQGESNATKADSYQKLLTAMITSWRKEWGLGDFPFIIVQLANYRAATQTPGDSYWAHLRDAQRLVASSVPKAALAVALDIGEADNIHPKNKQEVGRRLALAAEAEVYGKPVVSSGPLFDKATFDKEKVTVTFKPGTAEGLAAKDGQPIKGFAVAGEDRKFVWAEAVVVEGSSPLAGKAAKSKKSKKKATTEPHLVVSSPEVPNPVAIRYAWANNPEINLVNKDGLPASGFRTDDWPQQEAARPVAAEAAPSTPAATPQASPEGAPAAPAAPVAQPTPAAAP